MLTADLVFARKKGKELGLVRLDAKGRARAIALAVDLLRTYAAHVGRARDELDAAIGDLVARSDGGPSSRRMLDGLRKLLDDASTWSAPAAEIDPVDLRRAVFVAAAAARRGLVEDGTFDRDAIVASAAAGLGLSGEVAETALYGDLRSAQRLVAAAPFTPERLVGAWESAQAQAVLLRAVRVTVHVACASAGAYRALFRRLKFLRLLHEAHRVPDDEAWPGGSRKGGYRITIDGPFSLFESVTKYGLKLAMIVPVLESTDAFRLDAEVRWGPARTPLAFKLEGGVGRDAREAPRLADEVEALIASFETLASGWRVSPSPEILELPGIGICVPDLLFEHAETGARVHLEVLGYWSREAVWKRVELVEQGLRDRILFAVSKRLRVREDVLDDALPSALYVYKGTISARAVLERLEALRTR